MLEERHGLDPMLLDRFEDAARRAVTPGDAAAADELYICCADFLEALEATLDE